MHAGDMIILEAVGNYRAQFHWIMQDKTPAQVIETIREKIRHLEGDI
jgi:recombinational DNA repair protein RecR